MSSSAARWGTHHAHSQACVMLWPHPQNGCTVLDMVEGEESKEALVGSRFSGEELEDEFLQERLPVLVEQLLQAGKSQVGGGGGGVAAV